MGRAEVEEKADRRPEQTQAEDCPFSGARMEAYAHSDKQQTKSSTSPEARKAEDLVDRQIGNGPDKQTLTRLSHDIAEGQLDDLQKAFDELSKDPAKLKRVVDEMNEAYRKAGVDITLKYPLDKQDHPTELEISHGGFDHVYLKPGKAPTGSSVGSGSHDDFTTTGAKRAMKQVVKGAVDSYELHNGT